MKANQIIKDKSSILIHNQRSSTEMGKKIKRKGQAFLRVEEHNELSYQLMKTKVLGFKSTQIIKHLHKNVARMVGCITKSESATW